MSLVAGTSLHFNDLPPYLQSLLQLNKMTPFFNLAGQKNGVRIIGDKVFDMAQVWSIDDGEQLGLTEQESIDGVANTRVTRAVEQNGIQLFEHKPQISLLRESITGGASAPRTAGEAVVGDNQVEPAAFQIEAHLQKVQKDMDYSSLLGTLNLPVASTGVGEKFTMGGIIPAISTNAIDGAAAALSKGLIDSMLVAMSTAGAPFTDVHFVVNLATKIALSEIYGLADRDSMTFGGVKVDQIITDAGIFPVLVDLNVPTGTILVADMAYCKPVILPVKGQALLVEPKVTAGASSEWLIYAQGSFDYGNEQVHAKLTNFTI